MQYILIFGVVFVIMQAVILLFFFMISSAAEDVAGQIRKTFLKEMEVFDELYEEKAAKLKKVQEEYEQLQQQYSEKDRGEAKAGGGSSSVGGGFFYVGYSGGASDEPGFCTELPQYPPQLLPGYRSGP